MATKIKKSAMTSLDECNVKTDYNIMSYVYDSTGEITTNIPDYPNLFVTRGEKVFISGYWNEDDVDLSWLELNRDNGLTILSDDFESLIPCTYYFTFEGFMTDLESSVYAPHTCLWQTTIDCDGEEIVIDPQTINGSFDYSFSGYMNQMPSSVSFTDTSGYYRSFTINLDPDDFVIRNSAVSCLIDVNELSLSRTSQSFTISLKDSYGSTTTGGVYIMNSNGSVLAYSTSNLSIHDITVNGITTDKSTHPARVEVHWSNGGNEEVFDLNITTPNAISLTLQQPSEEYEYFSFNGSITFEGNSIIDSDSYAHLSITPVINGSSDTSMSDSIVISLPDFYLETYEYDPDWDLESSYLDIELVYNGNNYQKTVYFSEAEEMSEGKYLTYEFGVIDFNSDDWI